MNNAKGGAMNGHPIGTRVRINCPENDSFYASEAHGLVTIVASELKLFHDDDEGAYMGHEVDLLSWDGGRCAFEPHELIPLDDKPSATDIDTDATPNAVASWAGWVWTPERVRA
jgi:hypothetical protein